MNGKIKFRAWDKIDRIMREVYSINFINEDMCLMCDNLGRVQMNFSDAELMQYIGRRDINDKEIYEGDIVKVNDKLYEVIFDESYVGFNLKNYFDSSSDYPKIAFSELNNIEVVGNIYEDTKLLKEVE